MACVNGRGHISGLNLAGPRCMFALTLRRIDSGAAFMPNQTSAHLWDLRAQEELFLPELTSANKCLAEYREGHPDALANLRKEFSGILHTVRALREAASGAHAHVAELPEQYATIRLA